MGGDGLTQLPRWQALRTLHATSNTAPGAPVMLLRPPGGAAATAAEEVPGFVWDSVLSREGSYGVVHLARRVLFRPLRGSSSSSGRRASGSAAVEYVGAMASAQTIVIKELHVHASRADVAAGDRDAAYETAVHSSLREGLIHALVAAALEGTPLRGATPALYEVFARGPTRPLCAADLTSVCISMEHVRGSTLYAYLKGALRQAGEAGDPPLRAANDAVLLDVLVQLALALDLLQRSLGFSHRDLKVNNLLVRQGPPPAEPLHHEALPAPWTRRAEVVLIDFGFACCTAVPGGGEEPPLSAGTWFLPSDGGGKPGRDLAQFLYCLHCYFPLHAYFSDALVGTIADALRVPTRTGGVVELLHGINEDGSPLSACPASGDSGADRGSREGDAARPRRGPTFHSGIYTFLHRPDVDLDACSPRALLHRLRGNLAAVPPHPLPSGA